MTKVLFLAYFFPPVGGAGVQRALKFVQYLPAQRYLPVVLTGPTSPDDRWTPHDRTLMQSVPSSVQVHRVSGEPPHSSSRLRGRMERWLGTPTLFSEWWIRSATNLGMQIGGDQRLILATMSPFESGTVAQRLSSHFGIPWVADLRDPWALDEMQVYPSWLHRKVERRRMERLLSTAALIIMNTPEATHALKDAFPSLRRKKVITITNGFDRDDFAGQIDPRDDSKFRIIHTGYFHTESGMQLRKRKFYRLLGGAEPGVDILTRSHTVLLKAIELWCEGRPEVRSDVDIVFAGKTSEQDQAVARDSRVSELISFTGYVPHEQSVNLVRTADLLFLPMPDLPAGRRSRIVPGKTYEYLAAGRPILAAVPEGDAKDFVLESGMGLTCQPGDMQGMIRILDVVYSNWKTKNQGALVFHDAFVERFERRNLTRELVAGFDSLLRSKTARETESTTVCTQ